MTIDMLTLVRRAENENELLRTETIYHDERQGIIVFDRDYDVFTTIVHITFLRGGADDFAVYAIYSNGSGGFLAWLNSLLHQPTGDEFIGLNRYEAIGKIVRGITFEPELPQ